MTDDRKGATKTPGGGTITYDTEPEGPGFYYALPGNPPMRDCPLLGAWAFAPRMMTCHKHS